MTAGSPQPVFVDTGAFYARFKPDDDNHERATAVFEDIRSGEVLYRPLYTSQLVLSELATLLLRRAGHDDASRVLDTIRHSNSFRVLALDEGLFDRTCEQFARYDDQQISFVDHSSGVLAAEHGVDHVFTFDSDDFETLGFTVVPDDLGRY